MTTYNNRRYPQRAKRRLHFEDVLPWVVGAFIVLVTLGIIGYNVAFSSASSTVGPCVVEDKDRTTNAEGASDMRVYTENCGVLKVQDNWTRGVFNSADIFSKIKVGETYTFDTTGWRFALFSQFPVIYAVHGAS